MKVVAILLLVCVLCGCTDKKPTPSELKEMQRVADLIPTTFLYQELESKGVPPQWSNPRKMKVDLLRIIRDPKYNKIDAAYRYGIMAEDAVNIMVDRRLREINYPTGY